MSKIIPLVFAAWHLAASPARPEIVINEVHYDPEPKTDLAEFVELFNLGTEAVDLSGYYFSNGFAYTFPEGAEIAPNGYLILAQNEQGYMRKFGSIFIGGLPAYGEFESGALSNEGERISLRDAAGNLVDEVNYQANFPWPTAPQGELVDGQSVSMELLNPALDNNLGGSWRAAVNPTPGKQNSVFGPLDAIPPLIRQVDHSPKAPKSGELVVITAKVTDEDGVASVVLHHQWLEPGGYIRLTDDTYETAWEDIEMKDDGLPPDAAAGDDVYSAAVPEAFQRHRHLMRYRITVEDALGNSLRVPYADDPQPNFAYFIYDGVPGWKGSINPGSEPEIIFSAETMNSIAVYHLIALRADVEGQQWGADRDYRGTIAYEDEVYDHIIFRKRGRASLGQVGKEKWDWNFNRGHRFQAKDNYGRPYEVTWREINVLPGTNPWWGNDVSTDGTILNEPLAFRIFQLIRSPSSHTNFFQLRVIDDSAEAPSDQYFGDLWGLYIAVQDPDSRFLEERGLPDGNIYNWHGSGVKKNQGAMSVSSTADFDEFNGNLRNNTPLEWWEAHLNFDAYFAFNCGNLIVNNADMRPGENMMSYIHPEGQTYPIPWDLDLTFEEAPHLGRGDTPAWENIHRVLEHDGVDAAYQSRAREIQDLLLSADQSSMLVDEYSRFVWVDTSRNETIPVEELTKAGSNVAVRTSGPHGFETDDVVLVEGVGSAFYDGEKVITKVSDTEFTYPISLFAEPPTGTEIFVSKASTEKPLVLMDQAMWDYHPRKRKKGIYFENIRSIESEDFSGYQAYLKRFIAPGGYGYELLGSHIESSKAPDTPSITYTGPAGSPDIPATELTFETSEFSGGSIFATQAFAAMQWRMAEITDPARDDFDPEVPRIYEIDPVWQSEEISSFEASTRIPPNVARPGRTYRVRVRMKNDAGHWSRWSAPFQFFAEIPDISVYMDSLVISEIMFNPGPLTEAESAAGYSRSDFEFVELANIGGEPLDLTHVRFTKGADFDFSEGTVTVLEPGAFVVVVSNREAFEMRYGRDVRVAGSFQAGMQLANGGERLKLSFAGGTPIRDFEYGDGDGWPAEADGGGRSLVLVRLTTELDLSDPASWTASGTPSGSPGAAEDPGTGETYDAWLTRHFEDAKLDDEALVSPEADPDGDGSVNLLEFAFDGDPKNADDLSPVIAANGDGILEVTHAVPGSPVDLDYHLEMSLDLVLWEPASSRFQVMEIEGDGGRRLRQFTGKEPSSGMQFLRIRVSLP